MWRKGQFKKGHKIRLGMKHSEKSKEKMRESHKGQIPWNKTGEDKFCLTCGKKFHIKPSYLKSKRHFGKYCSTKCYGEDLRQSGRRKGKNHPNWKGNKCKKQDERNDSLYKNWVKRVKKRDNNTCKLKNKDCSGYNIVHHIKNWSAYPELRYNINNGITLCQAHHPRTRAKEKRLIPVFEELVSVSS